MARLLSPMWRGYQSCGEVTQPSVARLTNLWRDYLWRSYLVARLQSGYRWQSNISLESAISSSFSVILHLNCIGKHIGLLVQWILTKACFAVWTMFYDWFWYYGVSRAEISQVPLWHPWAEFFKGKNKMAARYFKVKDVFFNKWSQKQV